MTKERNEIYEALAQFQNDCPDITLNAKVKVQTKTGASYEFKYATLANIHKIIKKHMANHGLSHFHMIGSEGVKVVIAHKSGQSIEGEYLPIETKGNMQEVGSRITYAKRYTLTAILGIVADEDDDGNLGDGNFAEKQLNVKADIEKIDSNAGLTSYWNEHIKGNDKLEEKYLPAFQKRKGEILKPKK